MPWCGSPASLQQNSTDIARDFLRALLNVDLARLWSASHVLVQDKHFYPMAGILTLWRPSFVGYLETLQADWDVMEGVLGAHPTPLLEHAGQHETSKDPHGRRAGLNALLEREPKWRAALSCLLLYDFKCFGYPLPDGAGDCEYFALKYLMNRRALPEDQRLRS